MNDAISVIGRSSKLSVKIWSSVELPELNPSSAPSYSITPVPVLSAFKNLGFRIEEYPNAYSHFEHQITLPLFSKMTDEQVRYVVEQLNRAYSEVME